MAVVWKHRPRSWRNFSPETKKCEWIHITKLNKKSVILINTFFFYDCLQYQTIIIATKKHLAEGSIIFNCMRWHFVGRIKFNIFENYTYFLKKDIPEARKRWVLWNMLCGEQIYMNVSLTVHIPKTFKNIAFYCIIIWLKIRVYEKISEFSSEVNIFAPYCLLFVYYA